MRRRITTRSRVAVALLASAVLVAGCASSGGDGGETNSDDASSGSMSKDEIYTTGVVGVDGDAGEPVEGGTLTIAEYAEARSLDSTKTIPNGAVGGNALAAVYDVLMRYDYEADEFVPHLAESLEPNEDYSEWTLTLRDGVTFSDGTPLNAKAVVGSIGYYMQNRGFNTLLLASNIKAMKPVDEHTVVFTLNSGWRTFPKMLASGAGMILAPAAYANGPEKFQPIGAGAFTLKSYKPAEELVLTAREDYWGGAPHLDKVRFVWLGSDQAKMDSMESGEVDAAYVRNAEVVETARKDGWAGMMTTVGLGSMLWINNREGSPGADPRIRKAINMAIDPEVYVQRSTGGAGLPTRSIYWEGAPYYEEVETVEHDPEAAKKLVAEAKADGADTSLTYIGQSDQASQSAAVTVEAQLEAVGFDVKLDLLSSVADQVNRLYVTHEYDLAVASMSITNEAPYAGLFTNLHSKSPQNPSGYASKEMDQLLGQLQGAEKDEAQDILTKIHQQWQEDLPAVVLASGAYFQPWQDTVHGISPTTDAMLLLQDAWKEQ